MRFPPPHPRQLRLDGSEVGTPRRRVSQLRAWASTVARPMTVAELVAAWWPEWGDPRQWVPGTYPRQRLAVARSRVARMEAAGLVSVAVGPLIHRRQVGLVVSPTSTGGQPVSIPYTLPGGP